MARTSSTDYDFYTGLVTRVTDVDYNVSTVTEYDALGRPTKVRSAAGTALESWTRTEYDDVNRRVVVRSDIEQMGDGRKVAIQHFDQLGRVRLARTLEDPLTEDPYNETHGIKVETRYRAAGPCTFESMKTCSFQLTSNPFRAATSAQAGGEETMGWTLSETRNDGRYSRVQTFAGAALPAAFGGNNTNSTGIVRTDVDANRTLVADQAGKRRISVSNALGQLKEVWEILAASVSGSESVTFPNTSIAHGFKTVYSYDPLNNLTTVTQGVQTRTFTYSSLSRLLTATNPESGSIRYSYDPNGNLLTKTDARGAKTDYVYDALNRVTNRSYSLVGPTPPNYQPTPNVSYFYDNLPNARGKLIKVASSVSTTEYTAFDILGRVTAHKQTTDGQSYTTGYLYNLSGALIEETYPSGRVVKNVLDSSGDLSIVQSGKCLDANPATNATCTNRAGLWNYASSFTYNAAGAVTSMQLGNGLWESTVFNTRLQPTRIALGTTQVATNLLKLDYEYGATAAVNNGNVTKQTITAPTVVKDGTTYNGFTAVQTYNYDSLNRLKDATENVTPHGGTASQSWKQTFTFDRYGNRNFDEANTTFEGFDKLCNNNTELCADLRKKLNPAINASDNRLSSGQGYSFDAAGNTTRDAQDRKFTYDAENKQVKVESLNPNTDTVTGTIGEYSYDGDGKRIRKYVPSSGELTIFVYDAAGKLVAEYSTIVASTNEAKVAYLTADHLGSPRINTDANGNVTARHDYHPFGEEIATSQRTTGLGYTSDSVRKQFTSYERDNETELDFAQARYYKSAHGRFTTVDPVLMMPDRQLDPQQINLYAYCRNNPLAFIDPTGMILDPTTWDKDARKAYEKYVEFLNKDPKKYASELATLEQLKKSDVNYVIRLDQSGTDYSNGREGGVTTDGKDVFINIANQGNGSEKFSLNATMGHELEHARQFDSGEWGFASDKNGNFVDKNGKYIGSFIGVDIGDEVKAWSVTAKLATATDKMVMGGNRNPEFQFRILDEFSKSSDKAGVLAKIADNYKNMSTKDAGFPSIKGQPVGTLIRPTSNIKFKDQNGNSLKVFGRTR